MTLRELLLALAERGVWLWSDAEEGGGPRLRFRAPPETLTAELRAAMTEHKAGILAALSDLSGTDRHPALPVVLPRRREPRRRAGLNIMQHAYWLGRSNDFHLGGLEPHVYVEVDVRDLDVPRLERAVNRMVARHDLLRGFVAPSDSGELLWQVLDRVPPCRISRVDLRELDEEHQQRALLQTRTRMSDHGPSADQWPLFEILVHDLAGGRSRIHASGHLLFLDGTTIGLLGREAARLYRDPEANVSDVPVTFDDLLEGYEAMRRSPDYDRARKYWLDRVASLPPPPRLAYARDFSTAASPPRFNHREFDIRGTALARLRQRAQKHQVTVASAIGTAYCDVLAAWSEDHEMLVNVLSANRLPMHARANEVVGNFNNTVLLAVNADPQLAFPDRAERFQQQFLRDQDHALMSGVEVVREINRMHRNPARAAGPVVFNFQIGDALDPFYLTIQTAQVVLECAVTRVLPDDLHLLWVSVDELFPPGMVDDMFAAFVRRVQALCESDDAWRNVDAEALLSPRQLELQSAVNATDWEVPDVLLHHLFEKQADASPDAVAVVSGQTRLTYAELEARANSVAAWLRADGARPNQLVGVMMHKGWEQVVAVLAILKAGAAYLPIDPALPAERRAFLLDQCEQGRVLTTERLRDALPPRSQEHCFEVDRDAGFRERNERLAPVQTPTDLAYVIFTSGSTGVPKGVMIEHHAAANTILDLNDQFGIGPDDAVLALSSLSFDLSVYDVFGMLAAGARVVILEGDAPADPEVWLQAVVEHQVTIWNSVPAFMDMLATHAGPGRRIGALRLIMLSGDWIPVHLPAAIRKAAPTTKIMSLGGATEASIWSIAYPVEHVSPEWTSIPYGMPLRNQRVYVLDAALRPRPFLVPGEIFLAGKGVARGYWNDPKLSAERFITHPTTGEKLYKTGDMGRLMPDGNVEILGRMDFQVKVQGYRIELGEIEHALLAHPDVTAAVVVAVGKRDGARRLVAYVVLATREREAQLDDALSSFLGGRLPEYMVPSQYVVLDRLPLNANGKIDRKALPDPKPQLSMKDQATGPRTELERDLVATWTRILEIDAIGIGDNFFDAGGQSVTAVSLLADIRSRHGVELPLSVLVAHPTIEKLARVIQERRVIAPELLVSIQEGNGVVPIFCFHPVGGNVACYVELGKAFAREQTLIAVQAVGLNGEPNLHTSVPDMAREYHAAIQRRRARGPYVLGGWSMGGVIAHQVADLMARAGEAVSLVFTIDSHLPPPGSDADTERVMAWFMRDAGVLAAPAADQLCRELRALPPEERIQELWRVARKKNWAPGLERDQFVRLWQVFAANAVALARHQPPIIEAPMLVIDASRSEEVSTSWADLTTREVRRVLLDADHYTIVRPPRVADVAGHVTRALAKGP